MQAVPRYNKPSNPGCYESAHAASSSRFLRLQRRLMEGTAAAKASAPLWVPSRSAAEGWPT
mgnify:CR=1 FL=1